MIIGVGSLSKAKLDAVRSLVPQYPLFKNAEVIGVDVPSGISDQPWNLNEIIQGTMNRAKGAAQHCDYGFGIESGLMTVPYTKTSLMDVCACAIYDGRDFHLGLSSAFEIPHAVVDLMHTEGLELNDAFLKAKLPTDPNIRGVIESLTNGRVDRIAFTKQAITMALIHLEFPALYRSDGDA